ncbi:MAG TPA: NADH-ubiquinone oxidoreductase-F iron-sulfur binding region domain-containing protein [Phycisphaerae bacterium]|nr:NADH-ubiquinone oxidoreductase-F iron-sulfur binding region domain-containing protein [Phycisphaerae bacterium]
MKRFRSIEAFRARQKQLAEALDPKQKTVTVCGGTGCSAFGAVDVQKAFEEELQQRGLADRIPVKRTGCHGFCEKGPVVVILPEGIFYPNVEADQVPEIVEETVLGDRVIRRLLYVDPATGKRIARDHRLPFYAKQTRQVLRLNGILDPIDLQDYVARDGYAAAAKAMGKMTPEQVIDEILGAGLRGRGGAGFPTGRKWLLARQAPGDQKYIICNADEGDPGAFMDRSLLEGAPHAIIEGMIIAAYAIGAAHGIIYVRAEYPLAVRHTRIALDQARQAGLLGNNILGTGLCFDIAIHPGAGAFVCGEETALIASIEGRRGMPRPRPPFPATSGYRGKPTTINNVETLANVPLIILKGKSWYAGIGTEGSKGTKIFALAGKVNNTGLVEVPMGATLREIVYDIGGGIPRGRKFKAAQMGGPSGGCVPARYLDLAIDYDSVKDIGAIMGSGGLIVMDEATCMVDIARFFTDFCQKESCGKCAPCRVGTRRMLEILERICRGEGEMADIDRLEELGRVIQEASLCGLGQTAPNPVLSTIRHFRGEYEAHIREKRCPSHACEALAPISCTSACAAHVNVPEYIALIAEGRFAGALEVIRRRNPFPSVCGRACHHPCETFCRRGDVDDPVAIRQLKRFLTDWEESVPDPPLKWRGPRYGRVAVVGSGPAGLTAAYFLALAGRDVTVFEVLDTVGGMLAVGIPKYRLPEEALARDIEYIRRAGVNVVTGRRIHALQELRREGFDAIFIATGAHVAGKLGVPGEDLDGVLDALTFLRQVCRRELTRIDGRVIVIGGGNAAIDSARAALRLGAELVTILYRRTAEEMPATRDEIEDALIEGVQVRFLTAIHEIEGDGRARAVRCIQMRLGDADESGRRRPIPVPGSEDTIDCDWVIAAVGQYPDLAFAMEDERVVFGDGRLKVDPVTLRTDGGDVFAGGDAVTGDPVRQTADGANVFAGGDAVTGPATIIDAIAAGQQAAVAIDAFLGGKGELPPDHGWAAPCKPDDVKAAHPRHRVRALPMFERKGTFEEVIIGYSHEDACDEAHRCLRCDLE